MPFHKYNRHFGPEELAILEAAFDATWQELSAAGIDLSTDEKVASMKQKLAQRILVSATAGGVRDLDTLKEQALRSLGGGSSSEMNRRKLHKLPSWLLSG